MISRVLLIGCLLIGWIAPAISVLLANRFLALGDFQELNDIIQDAQIDLPEMSMSRNSINLKLYNVQCSNLAVGDVRLDSRKLNQETVQVTLELTDLSMSCRARYHYSGFLLNGRGDVQVTSRGNNAVVAGVVRSSNFATTPPTSIQVNTCNPTVNIDDIDFDGGVLGWILNTVERLLRDIMEGLVEERLCSELETTMISSEGFLDFAKQTLDNYENNGDALVDPLELETSLQVPTNVNLLSLQDQETEFGNWADEAITQTVDYLSTVVFDMQTMTNDLKANLMIREYLLEDRALVLDQEDLPMGGLLYEDHNELIQTTVRLDSVKLLGLDTLIRLDTLQNVGQYTLQNQLGWKYLGLEMDATIEILPSSLDNSIIETPSNTRILEQVRFVVSVSDLTADMSLLAAINQDLLENLRLGSLLQKENILPCFFSTIFQMELATFSVQATDIFSPTLDGFVSPGLDRMFGNAMDAGFLLYEDILLQASSAFFQQDIRPLLNQKLLQDYILQSDCPLVSSGGASSSSDELVDFRELLLTAQDALAAGATGEEPYGNLFSSFVAPNLKERIMQVDKFNADFVRPLTKEQSGKEGTLIFDNTLVEYVDSDPSSSPLYDQLEFRVSNIRINNLDTVTAPLNLLEPRDWNLLYNTLSLGADDPSKHLNVTVSVLLSIGGATSPLKMKNQVDFSLSVPSTTVSLGLLASLRESALLNFPLVDVTNVYCWLAALGDSWGPDSGVTAEQRANWVSSFQLSSLSFWISSFFMDAKCISCSSPGADSISEVLHELERAGFGFQFKEDIIQLVEEMAWSLWGGFDVEALLADAPRHCPHRPEYDESAGTLAYDWPAVSDLSPASVEAVLGIGLVALQTSMIVSAKNYLLVGDSDSDLSAAFNPAYPDDAEIMDWTNLANNFGDLAEFGLEELRAYLAEPIKDDPKQRSDGVTLRANSLLREHLLDDDGAYTYSLQNTKWDVPGFSMALDRVRIYGLDTMSNLVTLVPAGPQILSNNFHMEQLKLVFGVNVTTGDERTESFELSYLVKDVLAQLDLLVAIDLKALGEIQAGSIFELEKVLACAISGIHNFQFFNIALNLGALETPAITGYFSAESRDSLRWIFESMFDSYRSDMLDAIPIFLKSTFRDAVNALIPQTLKSLSNACISPTVYPDDGLVDFRDLLLSEPKSQLLGGSGISPYGDLFWTLYDILSEKVLRTGASNRPLINDVFRAITERQSNVSGSFTLPGNAAESYGCIHVAGLEADMGFTLSEVKLQHIDSVGDPLDLFRPLLGEPNIINNTVSFGVDAKPLTLTANVLLSLTDGAEMNVRNELNITLSVEDVVIMAEVLLKISENALSAFPIRDLKNINCWLATILSQPAEDALKLRGIGLIENTFSIGNFSMDIDCVSCTSPDFDKLLLSLYAPDNVTDLEATIRSAAGSLLNANFLPAFLDQVVDESAKQCPHHPAYDPNATGSSLFRSPAESLGFLEMVEPEQQTYYFNIANLIFAECIFVFGVLSRCFIKKRNKRWVQSLSREGGFLLQRQQDKEQQMQDMLNGRSTSLFRSPHIPWNVRFGVPLAIILNISLYLGGHLGTLSVVNIDATLAGEEFTIYEFLTFTFLGSTKKTFDNGGTEMAILVWIFTGIWPYVKLVISLFLWMLPPERLCVARRGRILLWIDALAKLSVIDIFTMVLGVAVLLIFTGGPDESLVSEGVMYSMKAIVVPRAGFYCIIVAQRMSRVSSRFFLEYHEKVLQLATRDYERKQLLETPASDDDDSSAILARSESHTTSESPSEDEEGGTAGLSECGAPSSAGNVVTHEYLHDERSRTSSQPRSVHEQDERTGLAEHGSPSSSSEHIVAHEYLDEEMSSNEAHRDCCDDVHSATDDEEDDFTKDHDSETTSPKDYRWGTIGVVFGGITVFTVFVIGCIFAPAISLDMSSLGGLAVESGKTFEEAVSEYGVFAVISGVLMKARFVLNTKADYIGFGLLLIVGVVSIAMVFFIQAYQFIQRKLKERQERQILGRDHDEGPSYGHKGCGLPFYFRLFKWKHMEIYLISVSIGVWQLGSISSYAIHMYCYILRRIYTVLTFIGLAEESSAQCYRVQASLPGNLIILILTFFILLLAFLFQALSQYRKNIAESMRWIDDDDVPRLSLVWSKDKSKNSRYSHLTASLLSIMDQFSDEMVDPQMPPGTPSTLAMTPPGTPLSRSASDSSFVGGNSPPPAPTPVFETPPRNSNGSRNPIRIPRRTSSVRFDMPDDDESTLPPPPPPRSMGEEMPSSIPYHRDADAAFPSFIRRYSMEDDDDEEDSYLL